MQAKIWRHSEVVWLAVSLRNWGRRY